MNNFYLYRFAGKRLSLLIPWDQDNSFSSDRRCRTGRA